MTDAEQQGDELEALKSIFEGDKQFTVLSENKFQYKFGEAGTSKSFLLEMSWPSDYPTTSDAHCSLDLFYNKPLLPEVKRAILDDLKTEAANYSGMPMTYMLLEFAREKCDDWLSAQPELTGSSAQQQPNENSDSSEGDESSSKTDQQPKQQLTKAQKRRMWDRGEGRGEKERGWNWVDIIRHLNQMGTQQS